jgi:3-hydroxyisobutyrate dehydrogenase-like beta-hydroxyacid dehydrogenase
MPPHGAACGESEAFRAVWDNRPVTRVGLLFPGEMGSLVGSAVDGEVLWASEGRSEATRKRAAGFTDVGTVRELVAASDIVISICPPAIAEDVAGEVAAEGLEGIYVEANAITPERMRRIAELLRCVDGSVIARTGLNLYLSGNAEDVAAVAALFPEGEVNAIPLEGGIGAASALKMAFGGWNKIGVALVAQAHAIARAYGVEDALAGEGVESDRILNAAPKAWRWAPEMEEVAATCAALGLPDGIPRGAAELYSRWDAHRDKPAELQRLLDDLTRSG